MKRLDQLGISPSPWRSEIKVDGAMFSALVRDANGEYVSSQFHANENDSRLISAAPELYEALMELVESCHAVGYKEGRTAPCYDSEVKLYRTLDKAYAALDKANGIGHDNCDV